MINITVLGAGLVGLPIALDLHRDKNFTVTLCDIRKDWLDHVKAKYGMNIRQADLSDSNEVRRLIRDAAFVVSAVPGHLGFNTLKTVIAAGKNVVDIAFSPEDPLVLEELAVSKGVIAITDMGIAPGMSNILTGYAFHQLDKTENVRIYVGGLPKVRELPFEYRAVFSPIDVIEEYTRPARFMREGKLVEMPALSEPELLDFEGLGTLEAFNSDGLRSLIKTIECPDMIEKTLRYPGHVDKIRLLKECGFFSTNMVNVKGQQVRPIDLTTQLLFPMWDLKDEEDLTVMKIIIEGLKDSQQVRYTWGLNDSYDKETGIHSMARTTGYAATAAVRLVAGGLFERKGVSPPEYLGFMPGCVEFMLKDLARHGIIYHEHIETL